MAFDPISAGISLVGGLFGAGANRSAERQARRAARAQAEYTNKTNLQNWEYAKEIRDYEYNQSLRIYGKSKEVYQNQLGFNQSAAARSYESESRKMDEVLNSMAFQKQDLMIQLLQAQGKVSASGSARGRSATRLNNDVLAQFGRDNAVMAENLVSATRQHRSDLEDINLQKYGADLNAYAALGLEPIKPPEPPRPIPVPSTGGGGANPLLTIGSILTNAIGVGYSAGAPLSPNGQSNMNRN